MGTITRPSSHARTDPLAVADTGSTPALTALAFGTARGYLLAVPVFLMAGESSLLAAIGVLIASLPQCVTVHIIVVRFVEASRGERAHHEAGPAARPGSGGVAVSFDDEQTGRGVGLDELR